MEKVSDDKKKVFIEDGKVYTLVNMGNYVGHKNRQWYEESPDFWKLMFYDADDIHIEALIDDFGDYLRLIADKADVRRILQLNGNKVLSDTVCKVDSDSPMGFSDSCVAYHDKYGDSDNPSINEYLTSEPVFKSDNGEEFEEEVPGNTDIIAFIDKNDNLVDVVNNTLNVK